MSGAFAEADLDSPRLCAELLLSHVLDCERLRLYMDADRPASSDERATLRDLVKRALAHEPIQYLVGEWPFFGIMIKCDRRALIPRPSSETLVEHILQHGRRDDHPPLSRIADICTGSGCIALAIAKNLPNASLVATDLSTDALALATENAVALGLCERVEFVHGDLLAPLTGRTFDLIVSNPPYISDAEWSNVEPNVKDHEPELALRGGVDGLDLIRRLIHDAPAAIEPGGWLVIETAASHARAAADVASTRGLVDVSVLDDLDGLPRVIVARRAM